MMYPNTTPVPNSIFDNHLKELQLAEIKVLLVIIRQTLGWTDRRTVLGRKERDWISTSQLLAKTGSSRRAISSAIETLVKKKHIDVLDESGNTLSEAHMRKGKLRLFYRLSSALASPVENEGITCGKRVNSDITYANLVQDMRKKSISATQKMLITKETLQN